MFRFLLPILPLLLVCTTFLGGCDTREVQPFMDQVTLQLTWKHQAQFAGFYVAMRNGYYQEENIEVKLLPRTSPESDVIKVVVRGDADFGITYGLGIVEARGNSMPVNAIFSIYQRYPISFISLAENPIRSPMDFSGKRLPALSPGGASILFEMLLKEYAIDKKSITFVQTGFDLERFFSGDIDTWAAYAINGVIIAKNRGIKITHLRPEDFEVNMPGDTLFTTDILINTNPDLVQRFVRATLRGWQCAVAHPAAAEKMSLYFDPELDPTHQIAMMQASIPYIQGKVAIGMLEEDVWSETQQALVNLGLVKTPVNIASIFSNRFIEEAYRVQRDHNDIR